MVDMMRQSQLRTTHTNACLIKLARGEGKERKGKERKGKERKGTERKGKERKGKERKGENATPVNEGDIIVAKQQGAIFLITRTRSGAYAACACRCT
eukprot:1154067-Pelagomonas_calceolata.AAC.4